MRLHRSGPKADWNKVRPNRRNSWQRLAEASHGVLTPGNIISIFGFLLVIWGSYLLVRHKYLLGFAVILLGRLADVFDGMIAERTKTKGPLGEFMDATIDKLALLVLLMALIAEQLVPAFVLAIVIVQSSINVLVSAIAKAKKISLRPTAQGKIATAAVWMCLFSFAVLQAGDLSGLRSLHALLAIIAYGLALVYTYFGFRSSQEYTKIVLDSLRYSPDAALLRKLSRVIIVVNPQSSNVHRIEKRGQELHKLFPDKTIALVETTAQASELDAKLKKEIMRQPGRTLICIGGGDGTVNAVVNALMRLSSSVDLSETPILPLWGGNANDFAYMLNGLSSRSTMRSLLGQGRAVAVYPSCSASKPGASKIARTTRTISRMMVTKADLPDIFSSRAAGFSSSEAA